MNLWKRIQRSGLQQRYIDDAKFTNTLRMIAALAFVPPDEVKAYFEQYCDYARNFHHNDCDPIIDYFEDTYIGRFRRNAPRRAPLFAQALWNMFHKTFMKLQEQITAYKVGMGALKLLLGQAILRSENLWAN